MKCKKCGAKYTVIDSTATDREVFRKRKCKVCGYQTFTCEVEIQYVEEVKKKWNKNYRK